MHEFMNEPPLWKRLRILANPLRLEMLTDVRSRPGRYVQVIGETVRCSEVTACKHLQMLEAGGFLNSRRQGRYLFYDFASGDPLAQALMDEVGRPGADLGGILKVLTAFTHERRIVIVRALNGQPMNAETLCAVSGISRDAVFRHLK